MSTTITLKKIDHSNTNSHETYCFSANVYKDGKLWCYAENGGQGGETSFHSTDNVTMQTLRAEIKTFEDTLPVRVSHGYELNGSLEIVVGDLITDWLFTKEAKLLLKRISYIKNGGTYRMPAKLKPTKENIDMVRKAPWWKPENIMLNDLTVEEVVEHLKA